MSGGARGIGIFARPRAQRAREHLAAKEGAKESPEVADDILAPALCHRRRLGSILRRQEMRMRGRKEMLQVEKAAGGDSERS